MSGGTWDYVGNQLEQAAQDDDENRRRTVHAALLLAAIEHELDWGYAGDTCPQCAEKRTIAALNHYFGDGAFGSAAAIALVRDRQQKALMCEKDAAR